ncbi:hypothetical protein K8I85_02295 [bacterium]|nr:hypothetical protein [bacterium]
MSGVRLAALAALALPLFASSAAAVTTPAAPLPSTLPEGTVALAAARALAARNVTASWLPGSPDIPPDWEREDWDWVDKAPPGDASEEKSILRAVAYSALLPGLGERYVGRTGRAAMFHVTEGLIWSTFAYYRIQGSIREDTHIEFANLEAGAATEQDADYYEHIGFWLSLDEWHDIVRRDARLRFPDDPAARDAFFEETKRYDAGQGWAWRDDVTRTRYRQLRSRTERSYRNARLAAGAAIFNRLASMIDALALARGHNRVVRESDSARLEWRVGPQWTGDGFVVGPVFTKRY